MRDIFGRRSRAQQKKAAAQCPISPTSTTSTDGSTSTRVSLAAFRNMVGGGSQNTQTSPPAEVPAGRAGRKRTGAAKVMSFLNNNLNPHIWTKSKAKAVAAWSAEVPSTADIPISREEEEEEEEEEVSGRSSLGMEKEGALKPEVSGI